MDSSSNNYVYISVYNNNKNKEDIDLRENMGNMSKYSGNEYWN